MRIDLISLGFQIFYGFEDVVAVLAINVIKFALLPIPPCLSQTALLCTLYIASSFHV